MILIAFSFLFAVLVATISENPAKGIKCYICKHVEGDNSTTKCLKPDKTLLEECPELNNEALTAVCAKQIVKLKGIQETSRSCLAAAAVAETGCLALDGTEKEGKFCTCSDRDGCNL